MNCLIVFCFVIYILNHEDFKNDKVISEPFGCGNSAIALYEIETNNDEELTSDLKYQKTTLVDSEKIWTVKIRYKKLGNTVSDELSFSVIDKKKEMSENMRLAHLIYMLGEKLRSSEYYDKKNVYVKNFLNRKTKFENLEKLNGE